MRKTHRGTVLWWKANLLVCHVSSWGICEDPPRTYAFLNLWSLGVFTCIWSDMVSENSQVKLSLHACPANPQKGTYSRHAQKGLTSLLPLFLVPFSGLASVSSRVSRKSLSGFTGWTFLTWKPKIWNGRVLEMFSYQHPGTRRKIPLHEASFHVQVCLKSLLKIDSRCVYKKYMKCKWISCLYLVPEISYYV